MERTTGRRLIVKLSGFLPLALLLSVGASAAPSKPASLALDGRLSGDGNMIELSWPGANGTRVGRVSIQRRTLGQTGKQSWKDHASVRSFARIYRDEEVKPGIAYEYRISRPSKQRIETGYWVTGSNLPAEENRGVALVVVDEQFADQLAPRLDRFMLDLTGDGWTVVRRDTRRGSDEDPVANLKAARELRDWIRDRYHAAHYRPHALILIGRVPVVKSGQSRPDGHAIRALETDLFYADTNAIWLDDGQGMLQHNAIPGDHIEMQVGRIDFSGMGDEFGDEVTLLRRYFDKNHHWRHGRLGDPRQAYGNSSHLFVEIDALRNIVGPENLVSGGHHDAGIRQPWLFGVDFGSAEYETYLSPTPIKAVFSINFGSGKLGFSNRNNRMKAMLAQSWYGLTTGWGGRPAWQLHHMALGKSIGYSHLRTVNNGMYSLGIESLEYTPTGSYPWQNPVWVNLLGDPTLRPFPIQAVKNLRAATRDGGVRLEWDATDRDAATKYRIYRASARFGPYRALNPSQLHEGERYLDTDPISGAWYMVRSHSLIKVHAGSFYSFSQGSFTTLDNQLPRALDQSISAPMGEIVKIRPRATDPDSGDDLTLSPIRSGDGGQLMTSRREWSLIPDAGFSGRVTIPFSVFDGVASDDGSISIDLLQP